MGHNLGMLHDFDDEHGGDEGECNGQGLMSYGDVPQQWSSCSAADYLARYNEVGGDSWCMEAAPTACTTDDDSVYTSKTKVLVVTGTAPGWYNSTHSEIIDLENESYTCSVEDHFPHFLRFASGGLIDNETPFLCGGGDSNLVGQTACYYLNSDGKWIQDEDAVLPTERMTGDLGSTIMYNYLLVFGDFNQVSNTFEFMTQGIAVPFTLTGTFPALWGPCTVPYSDDTFMTIGGYKTGGASDGTVDFGNNINDQWSYTYLLHLNNWTLSDGPNMNTARVGHGCSPIIVNDQQYIVVTGGKHSKRTTEILGQNYGKGSKITFLIPVR